MSFAKIKITESQLRSIVKQELRKLTCLNEAIVDMPVRKLSDIFNDKGRIHEEVVVTIQDAINKTQRWLSTLNLKITEVFVVGAAVTFQYSSTSDIDTSFVIKGATPDQIKKINRWMESNLHYNNWSVNGSSRPYQFKPLENNNGYLNADGVYDPLNRKWIKRPEFQRTKQEFEKIVLDPKSQERQLYVTVERTILPSLQRLYDALDENDTEVSPEIEQLFKSVLKRYKVLKTMRGRSYEDTSGQRISQNWGRGNFIFKFLDREGYIEIFSMIKEAIESDYRIVDQKFLNKLKNRLSQVTQQEPGYQKVAESKIRHHSKYTDA